MRLTVSVVIEARRRAERGSDRICSETQYQKSLERLKRLPHTVEHLVVQLGMLILLDHHGDKGTTRTGSPIAYPRMRSPLLDSKLDPLSYMARMQSFNLSDFQTVAEVELMREVSLPHCLLASRGTHNLSRS